MGQFLESREYLRRLGEARDLVGQLTAYTDLEVGEAFGQASKHLARASFHLHKAAEQIEGTVTDREAARVAEGAFGAIARIRRAVRERWRA